MSVEAPRNSSTGGSLDLTSEVRRFIDQKIKAAAEVAAQEAEERRLKKEEDAKSAAQERELLEGGDRRSREIIELSGIREILQQAKIGLVEHYGKENVTLVEDDILYYGSRLDDMGGWPVGSRDYRFRLAWTESGHVVEEYDYVEVLCGGWSSYQLRIQDTCFGEDQWRDRELLKLTILEAIKNPSHEAPPKYEDFPAWYTYEMREQNIKLKLKLGREKRSYTNKEKSRPRNSIRKAALAN